MTATGVSRARAILFLAWIGVGGLLVVEVALRIHAAWDDIHVDRALARLDGPSPAPGTSVQLRDMIRLSSHPRIIYELRSNMNVRYIASLTTNSVGFRGPEVTLAKPDGTVRIVGLGDSVMFGWGVRDEETYLSVLAKALAEHFPAVRWETINTAVPGYNTAMEVETLERRALAYKPDLVILNFVGNDFELPNFIRSHRAVLSPARSFLLDFVRNRLQPPIDPLGLVEPPRLAGSHQYESRPERVPLEYRDMVGLEGYRKAIVRLRALGEANGFGVLVVGFPAVYTSATEIAEQNGFTVVQCIQKLESYMAVHKIRDRRDPRLVIAPGDSHPSPTGHRIIAEAILAGMMDRQLPETLAYQHAVSLTAAQRLRFEFWRSLRAELERRFPGRDLSLAGFDTVWSNPFAPWPQGTATLTVVMDPAKEKLRLLLSLPGPNVQRTLATLEAERESYERTFGEPLRWRYRARARDAQISVERALDLENRSSWPELIDWIVQRSQGFERSFGEVPSSLRPVPRENPAERPAPRQPQRTD